jgi:hypothetical protein
VSGLGFFGFQLGQIQRQLRLLDAGVLVLRFASMC